MRSRPKAQGEQELSHPLAPQAIVAQSVAKRGERDGFHDEDFAIRQVVKLAEELGELAGTLGIDNHLFRMLEYVRELARRELDHPPTYYNREPRLDYAQAAHELVDLQIVVYALADSLERLSGFPFDVSESAVAKARLKL